MLINPFNSNATLAGLTGAFSQPDTYLGVFEEVTKQNIQLNIVERAWAVCFASTPVRQQHKY